MRIKIYSGIGLLMIIFLVALVCIVVLGVGGYFVLRPTSSDIKIDPSTLIKKNTAKSELNCITQDEFDKQLTQAYEDNDDEKIKYLEESVIENICSAYVEGEPTTVEPPLPPENDKYSDFQYEQCFFCESDTQMCQECWSNDAGEKVCCLKTVDEHANEQTNKCKEGDQFIDPQEVAWCRD